MSTCTSAGRTVEYGQYTSIWFTETVALEGLTASIGTVGDGYDSAAAGTVMCAEDETRDAYGGINT